MLPEGCLHDNGPISSSLSLFLLSYSNFSRTINKQVEAVPGYGRIFGFCESSSVGKCPGPRVIKERYFLKQILRRMIFLKTNITFWIDVPMAARAPLAAAAALRRTAVRRLVPSAGILPRFETVPFLPRRARAPTSHTPPSFLPPFRSFSRAARVDHACTAAPSCPSPPSRRGSFVAARHSCSPAASFLFFPSTRCSPVLFLAGHAKPLFFSSLSQELHSCTGFEVCDLAAATAQIIAATIWGDPGRAQSKRGIQGESGEDSEGGGSGEGERQGEGAGGGSGRERE